MNSNVMSIKVAASKRSENVNTMPKFLQEALEEIKYIREKMLGVYNRMYFGEDVDNDYKIFSKAYFDGDGNLINHYYRVQKETDDELEIEYETDENGEYILEECTLFKWYKLLSDVQTKENVHEAAVQLLIATYQDQVDTSISDFEAAVNRTVANNLSELLRAENEHKLELQTMFEGLTAETVGEVYQAKTNSINEIVSVKADSTSEIISAKQEILNTINTAKTETLSTIESVRTEVLNTISGARSEALLTIVDLKTEALNTISSANTASISSIDTATTNALTSISSAGTSVLNSISAAETSALTTIGSLKTEAVDIIGALKTEALSTIADLKTEALTTIVGAKTDALDTISDAEALSLSNIALSKNDAVEYVVNEVTSQTDSALSIANQAVTEAAEISDSITQAVSIIQSFSIGLTWSDFTENDWQEDGDKFYCLVNDITAPTAVYELVDDVREYRFGVDIKVDSYGQTILYSSNKFEGSVLGAQYLMDGSLEDEDDNEFTDEELAAMVITDWDDVETNGGEIETI